MASGVAFKESHNEKTLIKTGESDASGLIGCDGVALGIEQLEDQPIAMGEIVEVRSARGCAKLETAAKEGVAIACQVDRIGKEGGEFFEC